MASKAFATALKKKTKPFTKSRKAKAGGFSKPDIDDGPYVVRIGAKARVINGKPVVDFPWTVARGTSKGVRFTHSIWLDNDDAEREQRNFDDLSTRLQVLGYDMDSMEVADIPDILEEIDSDKPLVRCNIKNWASDSGNSGINCYFNELLEADDDEEDEGEEEETEETSDEEEEDDEE